MIIMAVVQRGKNKGKRLYPHTHEDGSFVVSPTKFERDYIRLASAGDIEGHLHRGLRLRMSNPAEGITAPSLIKPESISITR